VSSSEDLVRTLIAQGIRDERMLDAVRAIRREAFVPPASRRRAYEDAPLPIPHGQVTTQPSLSARMIEGLALTGEERVLEIGTGHGFQTALLATLARDVWSVERWQDLADTARANLRRHGPNNVSVVVGDGTLGLPGRRPSTRFWCPQHSRASRARSPPSSSRADGLCSRSAPAGART
jgi:protein-L-isoaspartate(D-aspartate) O-methyltransferase